VPTSGINLQGFSKAPLHQKAGAIEASFDFRVVLPYEWQLTILPLPTVTALAILIVLVVLTLLLTLVTPVTLVNLANLITLLIVAGVAILANFTARLQLATLARLVAQLRPRSDFQLPPI